MPQDSVLRKSFPRVDAADKVTGRSLYAGDVYLPGMLYCKVLKSPRSHARIVRIDTSKAEQLPGVRVVITTKDFPNVRYGSGALKDRRILARDEVFYVGEPVAAVAAVDEVTAQEALELVEDAGWEAIATDPASVLQHHKPVWSWLHVDARPVHHVRALWSNRSHGNSRHLRPRPGTRSRHHANASCRLWFVPREQISVTTSKGVYYRSVRGEC